MTDPKSNPEPKLPKTGTDPDFGRVYLSFDDGPDPDWTPPLLDVLAAAGARATFFVVGRSVRSQQTLVRRIADDGHDVANHTWSHRHPWTLREAHARREVRDGAAAISDTLGRAPRAWRPPFGRVRRCMVDEARLGGQRTVLWDLSAIDWGPLARAAGIAARLRSAQPGDIVLMHDGRNRHNRPDELLRALPGFLAGLRARRLESALIMHRA